MHNLDIATRIQKSLRYSLYDGVFYAIMLGFGESFFQAFGIFLRAGNIELGLLSSMPIALGSLSQLLSNRFITLFNSRKKMVIGSALIHGLMYLPIALVFFLGNLSVYFLIFFTCCYGVFQMILSPAWSSWMGDLVPEDSRGKYFGNRNRICGLATFFSLLGAGFILQEFNKGKTNEYLGFALIFTIALISRMFSIFFLTKKYEPPYHYDKAAQFSFKDFLRQSHSTHIGLLVFYLCFTNFAVMLAGPFFAAYMLYDLKLDYLTYTFITSIALIVKYLFMPMWGKLSDKYGTKKILSLSGLFLCILPILWLFSKEILVLVFAQIISGFIWAGFEIAAFNSLFDATGPKNRATTIAYYNVLNGTAVLVGSLLGGVIAQINNIFWSKYLFVFLVSGVLRLLVSIFYVPKLKEVRQVEHISYRRLILQIIRTMTTAGLVYSISILKRRPKKHIER